MLLDKFRKDRLGVTSRKNQSFETRLSLLISNDSITQPFDIFKKSWRESTHFSKPITSSSMGLDRDALGFISYLWMYHSDPIMTNIST